MKHSKWEAWLALCRKVESGGRNNDDSSGDASCMAMQQDFVDIFATYLPPPARVLAPGCLSECVLLANMGYEVHAPLLGPDNVTALRGKQFDDSKGGSIHAYEMDAHDLSFPEAFFDGYFSIQFNEHLLSWFAHLGETYFCMRDGGIAFVDAAGYNESMKMIWHTNLVPESVVFDQWDFWGFKQRWCGIHGDQRPQFVFEKLPIDSPEFRNGGYLKWCLKLRRGETVKYAYSCEECDHPGATGVSGARVTRT